MRSVGEPGALRSHRATQSHFDLGDRVDAHALRVKGVPFSQVAAEMADVRLRDSEGGGEVDPAVRVTQILGDESCHVDAMELAQASQDDRCLLSNFCNTGIVSGNGEVDIAQSALHFIVCRLCV